MHLAVYSVRAQGPRRHAHPLALRHAPWACACDVLPAVHYDIVGLGGPVRVAPYAVFGSPQLAAACSDALDGRTAALLGNHGALAYGRHAREAYDRAAKLEWLSQLYWNARQLGEPRVLTDAQLDEVRDQMNRYRYGTVKPA